MDKSAQSGKPDYLKVVLPERLNRVLVDELSASCLDDERDMAYANKVLLELLQATALESWKNGLSAGRKRSGKQAKEPANS